MILDRYPDGVRPGPAVLNSFPPLDESGSAAARSCAAMNRAARPQAISRAEAHVIADHPEQGWSLPAFQHARASSAPAAIHLSALHTATGRVRSP